MVRRRLRKNKNNKDAKSQHLETFAAEVALWEASIADVNEQFAAVPSNVEVNAKIEADETAVRKEHGLLNAQTILDTDARVRAQFTCSRISTMPILHCIKVDRLRSTCHGMTADVASLICWKCSKLIVLDLLSQTKAEEAQQASEYARFMADLMASRESMDTVVHDTGSAKDHKEYMRDNTQAQLVIQGSVPFPHLENFAADVGQWEASIDLTQQFAAVHFWRSTPKLKPTKPQ